jgi:hypothetical protein
VEVEWWWWWQRVSRFSHCRKDSGEILDRNKRPGLIGKYCIDDLEEYREAE